MFSSIDKILSPKLNICYYNTINKPDINNELSSKLLTDYSDLNAILNSEKKEKMKFFYLNKNKINDIINDSDKIINIKNEEEIKIYELFYLTLLILENKDVINYSYNFDFIKEINKFGAYINRYDNLKKVILSKIIIELIRNYKDSDKFQIFEKKELETIEKENKKIIKKNLEDKNLNINKLFNFDRIKDYINIGINVKEFYTIIILKLIKSNEFEKNQIIYNKILEQLEMKSIDINKNMSNELSEILNKKFEKNNFIITYFEDLLNNNKVNFYYIILKYLFKQSIYIYNNKLLLKTKKNITKLLKTFYKNNKSIYLPDNGKIDYIISKITDSQYYYKMYLLIRKNTLENTLNLNDITEILNYYKNYFFVSKKEEIKIIEKIIEKKVDIGANHYLKDLNKAKNMNKRFPIIKYLLSIKVIYDKIKMTETELNLIVDIWNKFELMISKKNFKRMTNFYKKVLVNYFNDNNNKEIIGKIFHKDEIDYFIKENENYLDKKKYKDDLSKIAKINIIKNSEEKNEILIKEDMDDIDDIRNLEFVDYSEIIKVKMKNQKQNENIPEAITNKIYKFKYRKIEQFSDNNKNLLYINNKPSKYKIIEFMKKIGQHNSTAEYIKELSNGFFISGNGGDINNNEIFIYNQIGEKLFEIYDLEDNPYNVYEINDEENKNKNIIEVIACLETVFYIINIQNDKLDYRGFKSNNYKMFLELKEEECLFLGDNGATISSSFFKNKNNSSWSELLSTLCFKASIVINKNYAAFIIDKINFYGEAKLLFYNILTKEFFKEIKDYSFTTSSNGLCLIQREEKNSSYKVLLCACKNILKKNKNGILLININNLEEKEYFYHTDYFEVNCLCPLLLVNNLNRKEEDITNKENIKIIDTDYFLAGGFDNEKRKGYIQLYKIEKENEDITIEYIQDIIFETHENFKDFEREISCITQSKITGNILVTSWDGNVYLFSPPNIDFYYENF